MVDKSHVTTVSEDAIEVSKSPILYSLIHGLFAIYSQ